MSVPTGWYKPVGINKEDREFHDTPDLRGAKENGSNPGAHQAFSAALGETQSPTKNRDILGSDTHPIC